MGIKDMMLPAISFRPTKSTASSTATADDIFKTLNSVYFDSALSTTSDTNMEDNDDDNNNNARDHDREEELEEEDGNEDEDIESIIRGAHTESRLFFEPSTAKIIAPANNKQGIESPFKESVATAMETKDPYADFRASMEEMVKTHGLIKEWGCLEDLLAWYLSVNRKNNHAYIVAAFVDLLVKLSSSSSSESPLNEGCSSSSSASRRSSSCVSGELQRQTTSCFSSTSSSAASDSLSGGQIVSIDHQETKIKFI